MASDCFVSVRKAERRNYGSMLCSVSKVDSQ